MVARGPGVISSGTRDELVSLNDIAPTVADLASVRTPGFVDGCSFAPLLLGNPLEEPWRDALLMEQCRQPNRSGAFVPTFQGVRTADNIYVEYSTGTKELYDLEADPYQLENRLQEPTLKTEAGAGGLSTRLKNLRECAGEGCRDAEETDPQSSTPRPNPPRSRPLSELLGLLQRIATFSACSYSQCLTAKVQKMRFRPSRYGGLAP